MTRSASRGISSKAWTISASRRPPRRSSAPRPTCPGRAGGGTPRSGAPRPRRRSTSPSASRTSPCPGFMRRNFTRLRSWRLWHRPAAAPPAHRTSAEHVHRPGARAELAQAVAHRLGGDRASPRGPPRAARRRAPGAPRAPRSACSPSRGRRRRGGAAPGIVDDALAVEEHVDRLVAVAAGDHDGVAGRARGRARASSSAVAASASRRASTRASGRFGVTTVARGRSARTAPPRASGVEQRAPDSATITGSSTTGVPGGQQRRAPRRRPRSSRRVAEHPDLDRVDADVLGDRADLRDDHLRRDRRRRASRRRCSAR